MKKLFLTLKSLPAKLRAVGGFLLDEAWPAMWERGWFTRILLGYLALTGLTFLFTGHWGTALTQFVFFTFLVIINMFSRWLDEAHDQVRQAFDSDSKLAASAHETMAIARLQNDRVAAVLKLVRQAEASGQFGIPTDVLLTEINRVPVPEGAERFASFNRI